MPESLPEASFSKFFDTLSLQYVVCWTIFILLQTCYGNFTRFFFFKTYWKRNREDMDQVQYSFVIRLLLFQLDDSDLEGSSIA